MKVKAGITIYLSVILVVVVLLVSVLSESARVSMVQGETKSFVHLAADSVMAGYSRQVYEDYGVLLVWEDESVKNQICNFIQDNINMADLNILGTNLMGTNLVNVKMNEITYVTQNGGELFANQIYSYMKYAAPLEAVDLLSNRFEKYQNRTEADVSEDVTDICDEVSEKLCEDVENINTCIEDLKDTQALDEIISAVSQEMKKIEKKLTKSQTVSINNFLKEYRRLLTELDKKAGDVNDAIEIIEQYDLQKEQFCKENGYTPDEGDYIDANLEKLKNIRDNIKRIKELRVSDFSSMNSKNYTYAEEAMGEAETISKDLKSLEVNRATEEDEKNKSIYESVKELLNNGILSLVIDEVSNISEASIYDSNLPYDNKKEIGDGNILESVKNKAKLALYINEKFGNYISKRHNTALCYEMEYIINGCNSDRDNLTKTIEKIVGIRNLMNLAYLVTDSEKMALIDTISLSAAMAIGLPFLKSVIKAVLMEGWALAEAVNDAKILVNKGKINLIKNKNNWRTSLNNLILQDTSKSGDSKGLNYIAYCQILLMVQDQQDCLYRIMDLIQVNIQKRYNSGFLMNKCFQRIDFSASFETQPLFSAMPVVINNISNNGGAYTFQIRCQRGY